MHRRHPRKSNYQSIAKQEAETIKTREEDHRKTKTRKHWGNQESMNMKRTSRGTKTKKHRALALSHDFPCNLFTKQFKSIKSCEAESATSLTSECQSKAAQRGHARVPASCAYLVTLHQSSTLHLTRERKILTFDKLTHTHQHTHGIFSIGFRAIGCL